jgi:hypothetical protein
MGLRPLVARPAPPRANDPVALDADRDRLGVAEAVRRRVAAGARVVAAERGDGVEPEQASELGELRVEPTPQARLERRRDAPGEALTGEIRGECGIQVLVCGAHACPHACAHRAAHGSQRALGRRVRARHQAENED